MGKLRIMAVDDERPALKNLQECIKKAAPEAEFSCFRYPEDAFSYASKNPIDVAFLDISMPGKLGTDLAKELKELIPTLNIIFVTAYSEYAIEAISLHASGYVLKPVKEEDVQKQLANLLHPIEANQGGVYVQTFGNFEVFVSGIPLRFKLAKAKEMFALLVDKGGASLTRREIAASLFLDMPYTPQTENYFSKIFKSLLSTLSEAGLESVIVYSRNSYAVSRGSFRCDLYDYERGDEKARQSCHGEYMAQYEWAIDRAIGGQPW